MKYPPPPSCTPGENSLSITPSPGILSHFSSGSARSKKSWKMGRITMLLLLLTNLIIPALLIDTDQVTVYPKHSSIFGVFHVSSRGAYAFNASVARSVCQRLGVTIADKAQVFGAFQRGFETCRFGWIDEQVAVIPRIEEKKNCGQGKVGVITWRASLGAKFDVFCFNLTDYEVQVLMSTTRVGQTTTYTPWSGVRPETAPPSSGAPHHSATSCPSCSLTSPQGLEEGVSSPSLAFGVVPTALVIVAVFTLLLAVVAAVWFKMGPLSRGKQEYIEAQVHNSPSQKDAVAPQSEVQSHSVEIGAHVTVTLNSEGEKPS
ncbi:lymphatic vessel endothelial hyaluronic acid receptor 1a [Brachyhypopomus gauderio]|uniref:lymphatic vessel endothelial hyaluronic acid receptor 1a n=1 Tax=Brachyhypopomus gauderio TaxID=698409 RepID=UPI0040411F5B